ncbi:uncharacterized protein TNCV_3846641 [Trichonephila clavipes]|nr:uncharacterized protein TNCV_3846641 [Trichonephila clavipes]
MACERKLLESEATTGFFVLLGTKGKKETLEWCMKANLIASRYECPRCKKEMRLQERKGTVDGYEWRCRSQSKDNPHDVVRSVRKGTWFSESKLVITIILRLTRYWFGKSMNAFVVNDDLTVTSQSSQQGVRKRLSWEELGSRKPPELLCNITRRTESFNVDNKLMRELFLQRLPFAVQTILAAVSDLTLNKAVDFADRILEVSPSPIETFAISNKKE